MSEARRMRETLDKIDQIKESDSGPLPNVGYTLKLPLPTYELYRLLQQIGKVNSPSETETGASGDNALLTFYEEEHYNQVKDWLSKLGIDFEVARSEQPEEKKSNTTSPFSNPSDR